MKKLFTFTLVLLAIAGIAYAATVQRRQASARESLLTPPAKFVTEAMTRPDAVTKKTTIGGTALYGFLSDWSATPNDYVRSYRGLYEVGQYGEVTKVYGDPAASVYDRFSCAFLLDGYLYGYAESFYDDSFTNFGSPKFLQVNFETGEIVSQTPITGITWVSPPAYNPEDGYFYFFSQDGRFCKSTIASPASVTTVKQFPGGENVISLAYCPEDGKFYGVDCADRFISIDVDGEVTVISDVPDKSSFGHWQSGMVWAPKEKVFYWDYIDSGYPSGSNLYTVTRQGVFTLECTLDDNSCFDWFVTTDVAIASNAPKAPTIDKVDFPEGALSGKLLFTMPVKAENDDDLSGELDWEVTLDGEVYKTGKAGAGQAVEAVFSDLSAGNHAFGVTASLGELTGKSVNVRAWIGNDVPVAPSNVVLSADKVTWEPSEAGIHGGYVDLTAITYNVTVTDKDGNNLFSGSTSATSIDCNFDTSGELSLYTAVVTAECKGLISAPAGSPGVVLGNAMTLPVHFDASVADFKLMTQFDKNNDNIGWNWDYTTGSILAGYSDRNSMDDYLFLPPISFPSVERIYEFAMEASAYSPSFPNEYLDVVLATEPTYDGVIESLIDRVKIDCAYDLRGNKVRDFQKLETKFKVIEPGKYYIGIHCSSSASMAGILVKNIDVVDGGIVSTSPAAPENLVATAASDGKLSATVSFKFPALTIDGDPLDAATELKATIESTEQTVTVNGIAGATATAVVSTLQGDNEISVYVTNSKAENSPKATVKVFTGQNIPAPVSDVHGVISDDMLEFSLFWSAPSRGANGGYIDPSQLTYNVYRYDPYGLTTNWIALAKGLTQCEYTFRPDVQDYYRIAIEAVNVAGVSTMVSGSAWAGPAYKLPYVDNFASTSTIYETQPWRIYSDGYYAEWTFIKLKEVDSSIFGNNDKIAMYCSGVEGTMGRVFMPRFTTEGAEVATLSLDVYTGSKAADVTLYAYSTHNSSVLTKLGQISAGTAEGISTVSFQLPDTFMGEPWVQVVIDPEIQKEGAFFAMTKAEVSPTAGIADVVVDGDASINPVKDGVVFIGHVGDAFTIATIDGRIVENGTIVSTNEFHALRSGTYVVKAGQSGAVVLVK